ncbi:hypothetical protein BZG20_01540 [Salinivibrio sp. IB868]|uniref:hypothetical protein n=1 Tax=unclassified Salinivibrio TaxID=2636825 RepID=UPI00098440CB|nr:MULTISPECIES: hypothetical protein [unclassified Salinivibrio]OOE69637.1 hypothetical protein BZG20_01540 [Salinivibrio sp. IB868]OOE73528.1 hypothetical protein BZG22_10450 [Salinivibrio sp. IB870]
MTDSSFGWEYAYVYDLLEEINGKLERSTKIKALELACKDSVLSNNQLISEFSQSLKLIKSVQMNLDELFSSIAGYVRQYIDQKHMTDELYENINLDLTRQFLNLSSMFRSLLDHSDFSISRLCGKESPEIKKWKASQSELYDAHSEYRLFYKLRNYCQHVGIPPFDFQLEDSMDLEEVTFQLDLKIDILLEEKSVWNSQLKQDLRAFPENLPVVSFLEVWHNCFQKLSEVLLDIKANKAYSVASDIVNLRVKHDLPAEVGKLCLLGLPLEGSHSDSLNMHMSWLPELSAQQIVSRVNRENA